MKDPRLGAVADFAVLKTDGTLVDYGKRHNIWAGWPWSTGRQAYMQAIISTTFYTHSAFGSELLVGNYTLSGDRIFRQTGNVIFNSTSGMTLGDYVQFTTGEKGYVINKSINLSTIQISISGSVPTPTQLIRNKTGTSPFYQSASVNAHQSKTLTNTVTVSPSSITKNLSGFFTPATYTQTINTIVYQATNTVSGYFMLSPPIILNVGDALIIKDFKNTLAMDIGTARPFINDDYIVGLSGTGTLQRFLSQTHDITTNIPNRILLMNSANKVSPISGVPYSATTYVAASNIPTETIVGSDLLAGGELPTYTNNSTAATHIYGIVNVGGSDISQIILGYWTGSQTQIVNVINYDTPVNIPVNKVLSFKNTARIVLETPF